MRKFNLLKDYPTPDSPRVVSVDSRTIENRIIASYKDKEFYDGDRNNGFGGFYYDGRWNVVAQKIIKEYELKDEAKILQMGSDKGFLLRDIKEINKTFEVYGLEYSKYAINNSENIVKSKIIYSENFMTDFNDSYFNFVIALGVVYTQNIKGAISIIKEIERLSNGKSFITLASYQTKIDFDLFKDWTLLGTLILKEEEWENILKHCGYTGDYYFTNAQSLNLIRK